MCIRDRLRVAAYCRVSTKEEEQLNSYEVQTKYYIEKINSEPKWSLVEIFADKMCIRDRYMPHLSLWKSWVCNTFVFTIVILLRGRNLKRKK